MSKTALLIKKSRGEFTSYVMPDIPSAIKSSLERQHRALRQYDVRMELKVSQKNLMELLGLSNAQVDEIVKTLASATDGSAEKITSDRLTTYLPGGTANLGEGDEDVDLGLDEPTEAAHEGEEEEGLEEDYEEGEEKVEVQSLVGPTVSPLSAHMETLSAARCFSITSRRQIQSQTLSLLPSGKLSRNYGKIHHFLAG